METGGWWEKRQNGSLIVENSFVIPMVLFCLLLLVLVNFYLHDLIVLQSLTMEGTCADQEDEEKLMEYLNTQAKEWTLIAGQTCFYKEENRIRRKYRYCAFIKLPVLTFFERKEGDLLSAEGVSSSKNWNIAHILRLIQEKGE